MFTGIVQALAKISALQKKNSILRYAVNFPSELLLDLKRGASVSIDGTCQTVVDIEGNEVWFEAIEVTLAVTTLNSLEIGSSVNVERSLKMGDEIGGHLLSGHVYGKLPIASIEENIYTFKCPAEWMKYLFPKGFIALDGVSLTLAAVTKELACFSVHLIPETLKRTTLGHKKEGSFVNLEFDAMTLATVDTVLRYSSEVAKE